MSKENGRNPEPISNTNISILLVNFATNLAGPATAALINFQIYFVLRILFRVRSFSPCAAAYDSLPDDFR